LEPTPDHRIKHPGQIFDLIVTALMQIPAPNPGSDRFHRFIGNCRTEIDEVFTFAILRSPPEAALVGTKLPASA
jgi:hypothetical protein